MARTPLQTAMADAESFGTTLLAAAVDEFGFDLLGWAPETIRMEVEEACGGPPPDGCYARLMAAVAVATSDAFYASVPEFNGLCRVLSGVSNRPDDPAPVDAGSAAWGVVEAALISPPDESDDEPFDDDVRRYIGAVLDDEGFGDAVPDVLQLGLRRPRGPQIDDPEVVEAAAAVQEAKRDEILELISAGLRRMSDQFSRLHLKTGSADALRDRLAAAAKPS